MNRRAEDGQAMEHPHPDIEPADSRAQMRNVHAFWYQVYVEEMGKAFEEADHDTGRLDDGLDAASTTLSATLKGGIIGTIRITWGDQGLWPREMETFYSLGRFDRFPHRALNVVSRLIVHPEWRGTPLTGRLFMAAYRMIRSRGGQFCFACCAPNLVRLYEQIGMRRYKENIYDAERGLRIPLVICLDDTDYLHEIRSPLIPLAREMKSDPETAAWFRRRFPLRHPAPTRTMREDDLWAFFNRRLHEHDIPLFQGLTREEISAFLKAGTILTCAPGDPVIRRGHVGEEMFLILSGVAEVCYRTDHRSAPLTTLSKGQIFGEMAFLSRTARSADVVARTDIEVLVITKRYLETVRVKNPDLAAKVLLNLSLILCERLRATTLGWVESIDLVRMADRV